MDSCCFITIPLSRFSTTFNILNTKYVDVQSLYPYVCKNKHYPIGYHRCIMGSDLKKFGIDVSKFKGLVTYYPIYDNTYHYYIGLLCRKCVETENQPTYNYSVED